MMTKDPDVEAVGMLCRIHTEGISGGSRPGEMKLVDAKFCGGVYWYKVVSSKGETGWTNQAWRLEAVDGS